MSKRLLVSLLLSGLTAACSLAPDYRRPEVPVPGAWPDSKVDAGGTARPTGWQALLPDERLRALVAAALEHNRDLRVAVGRVEEARALAGVAAADRLPTLDAAAQRSASLTPGDLTTTGRPLNAQRYDANLAVTAFELDFWGRVKNLDAAARAGFLASGHAREAFRQALIADVASAYFSVIELQERMALAAATVASRGESRRLVQARRDVGLAGDLDVLAADGALQAARGELASLRRQAGAAQNALDLLVGTRVELPAGRMLAGQDLMDEVPVGLPAEVLLQRPDIAAAEQRLIAANANIGAARAAFLPRITLTAAAGSASRALSGLFDAGSRAWSFLPVLRLPLFDAGRSEANVDLAEARKVIAVAEYEKAIQQGFREVADQLLAREQLREQLAASEAQSAAQSARLRIVEARHAAGVSSYLELLDAQREQFAAQQSTLAVRRLHLANLASLYKALARY